MRATRWAAAGLAVSALATALLATAALRAQAPAAAAGPLNLDAASEAAGALPRLRSLLVSWRGQLVLERYYHGARRDRAANIKSASKSVISALVGIAIDRGLLPGINTPIVRYFPELARDRAPEKSRITIEDLLTMRSGLESTSNRHYGAWVMSASWVRYALNRPMTSEPGEVMRYSTGNTHLLSAILTQATGKSTWQFANEALARPLGFSLAQWPRDPQGIYFGGNDMLMTPRQMLAFGELYLRRGQVTDAAGTRQLVPASWIAASCVGRARSEFSDQLYGYSWWIRDMAGYDACFAWGYGGQYVFVVPALDLVVVTTSSSDVSDERRGHRRMVFDIIERLIVEPVADAGRSASSAQAPH